MFYTDVEAWLELADMYASCNQSVRLLPYDTHPTPWRYFGRYTSALQSLTHALLLNPQNPYHVLQAAETAYTADDIPLAIRMFLLVTEMTDCDEPTAVPVGIAVRAWLGVVLVRDNFLLILFAGLWLNGFIISVHATYPTELARNRLAPRHRRPSLLQRRGCFFCGNWLWSD
jgi:hypothetical protein